MRALLAIGLVLTTTAAATAQDGLRSASLPERPVATKPPGPDDRFRATPETYRPHDRPQRPLWRYNGGGWPYLWQPDPVPTPVERPLPPGGHLQLRVAPADAYVFVDGGFEGTADSLREPGAWLKAGSHRVRIEAPGFAAQTFHVRIPEGETVTHRATLDRPVPTAPAASLPSATIAGREPRPLYVIPRCYAGDRPPDATTHCDLTQLRTIR